MNDIFNNDFDISIISIAETIRNQFWSRKHIFESSNKYTLSYFHEGSFEFFYKNTSYIAHAPFIKISSSNQGEYTVRAHTYPTRVISSFFTTNTPLPMVNDMEQSLAIPKNPEETDNDFKRALQLYTENPQKNVLEYKGLLLMLIGNYFKCIYETKEKKYPDFIADSLKYIDMHKDRSLNLNVRDIAAKFNVSYEYYVRQFKKYIGVSPKQYIIKIKMEYIEMLVCKTDMPISEIAFITGFSNPTYFYNSFKSHYGVSPNAYREKHKKF